MSQGRRMASGLRGASKRSSSRSLGSFVEVGSSSSEFEPVDLEEMESHSGEEGESQEHQVQQQQGMSFNLAAVSCCVVGLHKAVVPATCRYWR